ncbi:ribonuclease HI family protein [Zavarzinella formosa]|uniref:ribonuclease HI family protein n=1 Tax=Zavarzinella formosa TaxID=360055 RepID=UPI0002E6880A|nr:ribonuclease HI family protein [Zavarzinella formosa]
MSFEATIHIDGGSRGNPGPASYAVVLKTDDGEVIEESGFLGQATNNVAEYTGLIKALELASKHGFKSIHINSDSELLVKQMAGEYRVKNEELKALFDEASALRRKFTKVNITHVRRELNKRADELCNITLDRQEGKEPKGAKVVTPKAVKQVTAISDGRVRGDCVECLESAKACWQRGDPLPDAAMVWDQLWSILEEAGVLRK